MQDLFKKLVPYACLLIVFITGCRKEEQVFEENKSPSPAANFPSVAAQEQNGLLKFDSYVAQSWYNLILKLIKETPGHTPPIAARSFGYTGVTLYESLLGGMPPHHSLTGQLQGFASVPQRKYGNAYSAPVLANASLARIIKNLFLNASAGNMKRIDSLESSNNSTYSKTVSEIIFNRSRDYGRAVADAVFNWSLTDGGQQAYLNNFPSDYISPGGAGAWMPTLPLNQKAMLPYWGNNRSMVAANGIGPIDPPLPPAFSTTQGSSFYDAAFEVYTTRLHLSPDQQTIALYWADGGGSFTPAGHNIAIAIQMIRNHNLDLSEAAVLLAKLGIAENDAGIVCWRAKFNTNLLRPISFIRSFINPSWTPLINTPPFPTYTSGHSTFSGAAAAILTSEIGNNISFTDSSKMADGFLPRSFINFNMAAQEAAVSRLYGGIHYSFDNENGYKCGQLIADNVKYLKW
jgi:membrane-associated phospholipid phosphatase